MEILLTALAKEAALAVISTTRVPEE